ncbi:MAG: undecaprenyl-diphosphatase UppP [Candidatus Wildermuthbacteria bacterium]|nr:undecaprenyl-diphosphatase UppP [Candidatus Wildermuthbacteria bacterium]
MNIISAFLLGAVEGITEFLPISSTGHLILFQQIFDIPKTEFLKTFDIAIQLGAIAAVVFLFQRVFFRDMETVKKIAIAFLPTGALGLLLYPVVKRYFLSNSSIVLWALFLGGLFLIFFEMTHQAGKKTAADLSAISQKQAFFVGLFQSLAMIPGVSRSAATIIGGLILGIERKAIVEFSFLLAVPTIGGAAAYDLLKNASAFSFRQFELLIVGFCVAFLTALYSMQFLLRYIQTRNFIWFGVYRVALAFAFFLAFLF